MQLYHYSNIDIRGKLKTDKFGSNIYTFNDSKISNVKRIFFFGDKNIPEYRFKYCKYKYIVNVKNSSIYDLRQDKKGYIDKYSNIDKMLKAIKRQYKGILYNVGYDIVCIFTDVKIKRREVLK